MRRRDSEDPGGRRPHGSPGRSRMRQDKLTGSLRRGGRCLKRQGVGVGSGGGSGGGGVGTILSNVLKKRSCISRTAPRLLCTLEPGEDPGRQMGHWKVAWRPRSWCLCLSRTPRRPGNSHRPPGVGYRGWAQAGLGRPGREERGPRPGRGQRPPTARRTGCSRRLPVRPHPTACVRSSPACAGSCWRAMRSVFSEWWESVGGYPGYQRPSNQLCFGPTRSHTLKEVCEAGERHRSDACCQRRRQ